MITANTPRNSRGNVKNLPYDQKWAGAAPTKGVTFRHNGRRNSEVIMRVPNPRNGNGSKYLPKDE